MIGRLIACFWLLAGTALAQQPVLRVQPPDAQVILGQPAVLRITVLVPTWMTRPPDYPDFEVPNLLVRLPSRATQPVSERIDGETWSGTTRTYRLYPLAAGPFEIPSMGMKITYADPENANRPTEATLPIPALRFVSGLPAGAAGLDPPVVARGFTLEQEIEGAADLSVGDAITRTVTARIDGTTPILIPQLAPRPGGGPLRPYSREPVVSESENRGILSGSRTETVTYVAQEGGVANLPEIAVDWFNLETGTVETARVDGLGVRVAPPPPPPPDPLDLALRGLGALLALGLVWWAARRIGPHLGRAVTWARARWLGSEMRAHRTVLRAFRGHDIGAVTAALEGWRSHWPGSAPDDLAALNDALRPLRAARYAPAAAPARPPDWRRAEATYRRFRVDLRRRVRAARQRALPPLNPVSR